MAKPDGVKTCLNRHTMITIDIIFTDIHFVPHMNRVNPDQTPGVLLPHQIRDLLNGRN